MWRRRKRPELTRVLNFQFENEWGVYNTSAHYTAQLKNAPVVIFAHGLGATKDMYNWLIKPLIQNGFVPVMFTVPKGIINLPTTRQGVLSLLPSLRPSISGLFRGGSIRDLLNELEIPALFTLMPSLKELPPFEQFPDGIISCMDTISEMKELSEIIDLNQISLMGHSAGGLGSLIVAGQDKRVKNVIALAPPVYKGPLPHPPKELSIPVQLQVGTKDGVFDTVQEFSKQLSASKNDLVIIQGGDHIQFMDGWVVAFIRLISPYVQIPWIGELADISLKRQHQQCKQAFLRWLKRGEVIK